MKATLVVSYPLKKGEHYLDLDHQIITLAGRENYDGSGWGFSHRDLFFVYPLKENAEHAGLVIKKNCPDISYEIIN